MVYELGDIMLNNKYLAVLLSLLVWQTAYADINTGINNNINNNISNNDTCPLPETAPDEIEIINESRAKNTPFVDKTRAIKDLGTDIVVNEFFTTPDTLYNFMDLVYNTINNALADYRKKHDLDDKAIFLLFKGGNVLRIVANGVFEQVGPKIRKILEEKYDSDFKRSDADFSVYIDSEKLGDLRYTKVFDDISKLVFAELGKIRAEFFANPKKYFNFFQLKPGLANKELEKYFGELKELPLLEDKDNEKWYNTKFEQIQLLDARANKKLDCGFMGQYDWRFENRDDKIVGTPLSTTSTWIANTDNRTSEWPLGSNPKKKIKLGW